MSLRNLLQTELVSCPAETPIKHVAELMEKSDVGAVLITGAGKPLGIVTDRDIAIRCVAKGLDGNQGIARDIMTKNVQTVSIDDGIMDVVRVMQENEVRRVPVVQEGGIAVGLLSFGDIFELLTKEMVALSVPATPKEKKIVERRIRAA